MKTDKNNTNTMMYNAMLHYYNRANTQHSVRRM